MTTKYNVVNGTAYKLETSTHLIAVLEHARQNGQRILITYGNLKTGRVWNNHPSCGYVSQASGTKLPVLLAHKHSGGGFTIMDTSIMEIKDSKTKEILYHWQTKISDNIETCEPPITNEL